MNKYDYDVVVVGGGPCGSSVARTAAEKGLKTILLEEDPQIGLPEHCVGVMPGTKSGFLEKLLKKMDKRVVITKVKARRIYAPNGKMVEERPLPDPGPWIIERNLFDLELARLAANAGAEVMVNTRVTSLIKEDGIVKGVNTSSSTMPKIHSKIVIAADGLRALFKGIAKWEGISGPDKQVASGLKFHLTGVKDIEPGVIEFHLGSFTDIRCCTVVPRDNVSCVADAVSMSAFERTKAGNWVISKKLRGCRVLRMTGWSFPVPMGMMLPKKVKDGLMLAGDAAGFLGIDLAVDSGRIAAEVAAKAIQEGDITETGLAEYEKLCQKLDAEESWFTRQFHNLQQFSGLSDEEIQKRFEERAPNIL